LDQAREARIGLQLLTKIRAQAGRLADHLLISWQILSNDSFFLGLVFCVQRLFYRIESVAADETRGGDFGCGIRRGRCCDGCLGLGCARGSCGSRWRLGQA
jgi:hypothetical protein